MTTSSPGRPKHPARLASNATSSLVADPNNRGPFVGRMRRMRDTRAIVLELVPGFEFGLLTPEEAGLFASQVRAAVARWFGSLHYSVDGLDAYVRCTADVENRLVRVDFLPASNVARQGCFAANPEMLLALADVLDRRATVLGLVH